MHHKVFDGFPFFFHLFFLYFTVLSPTKYSSPQMDWFSVLFMPLPLAHCCNDRIFHWIFSHNHLRDAQKSFILSAFLYVTTTAAFPYVTDIASILKSAKHVPMGENRFQIEILFFCQFFCPMSQAAFHSKNIKLLRTKFHLWPSITFTVHTNNVFEKKKL